MERSFISRKKECSGQCKYCFGKWENYKRMDDEMISKDELLIYPNCDGDIFDEHFLDFSEYVYALKNKNVSFSISTKFCIENFILAKLKELDNHIRSFNSGILKISVSFSCAASSADIEKGVATYEERIDLVKRIYNSDLLSVIIIKPILPFVDVSEYYRIVDDTISFCPYYVLGDLYVDRDTSFYKEYIQDKFMCKKKDVSWNGRNGDWYVEIGRAHV